MTLLLDIPFRLQPKPLVSPGAQVVKLSPAGGKAIHQTGRLTMMNFPATQRPEGPRRAPWWLMLLLVLVTVACYARTWNHDFVYFDDPSYVVQNPHVNSGLSWANVRWAFNIGYSANWHPLTWLSLMTDCQLFGVHAGSLLMVNYLQHAVSSLLLLHLLLVMTGSLWRSAIVSALFALHPTHVESVAWVTERKDTLSTLLGLVAILAYVHYTQAPSLGRYLAVVVGMSASLMAKPMFVTLPVLLLLLDFWPLRRLGPSSSWRILLGCAIEKLPLLGLSLGSAILTMLAQRQAMSSLETLPISFRLGNAAHSTVMYLVKTIWPTNLAALYPLRYDLPWILKLGCGAAIIVVTVVVTVQALRSDRHRVLAVGWFWYLVTLMPVIGLVQVGVQAMADRYTYVPHIGVFVLVAWLVPESWLAKPRIRTMLSGAAVFVLATLAWLTFLQVGTWRNTRTLWSQALAVTERNYLAANNVGFFEWKDAGNRAEAERLFRLSMEWSAYPPKAPPRRNLAQMFMEQNRWQEAADLLEIVIRVEPQSATAWNDLGICMASLGQNDKALLAFTNATKLSPDVAQYHHNRGVTLADLERHEEAVKAFVTALEQAPGKHESRVKMADSLLKLGKVREAEVQLLPALRADERSIEALKSYAGLLGVAQRYDERLAIRRRITQLAPGDYGAWWNLAEDLMTMGQFDESSRAMQRALGLRPRDGLMWNYAGEIEMQRANWNAAKRAFTRAVELAGDSTRAPENLRRLEDILRASSATQSTTTTAPSP